MYCIVRITDTSSTKMVLSRSGMSGPTWGLKHGIGTSRSWFLDVRLYSEKSSAEVAAKGLKQGHSLGKEYVIPVTELMDFWKPDWKFDPEGDRLEIVHRHVPKKETRILGGANAIGK